MLVMHESDIRDLARAKSLLEYNSLAVRLADYLGRPLEWSLQRLPAGGRQIIAKATSLAVSKAADLACWSLGKRGTCRNRLHLGCALVTGAVGGAGGLATLPVELPATTSLILRSIAQTAREQGEDLSRPEARLACVQVLALGGRSKADDAMDTAYLTARYGLANEMRFASTWLADQTTRTRMAPPMVQLVQRVAARFGVVVNEKAMAQFVPVVGALGGATLNGFFMDHFQDKAAGHFIYRRLERAYGPEVVAETYRNLNLGELGKAATVHPVVPRLTGQGGM